MATSPREGFISIKNADITLGRHLGGGGFGSVRLANHKNWGEVAVKQFKNETLTKEILREAKKMLRAIHSRYIVHVMGLIEDADTLNIVMEYFENGSLKSFHRKYMNCDCWARKVRMILDISLGMNYLHTLDPPIIHLDLKLDNVFVANGFDAKIGDLGLAISSSSTLNFNRGDTPGTLAYIPPEAWKGTVDVPDEFWDIFTFAITLFELLSGKEPWQTFALKNASLIAFWVESGKRPDVSQISSEAPPEIVEIMKKCWNEQPSERPKFQEIQQTILRVFESKYKKDLPTADIAIMQNKHKVDTSIEQEESDSWDSGFTTLEGDMKEMSVDTGAAAAKDSGTGTCMKKMML